MSWLRPQIMARQRTSCRSTPCLNYMKKIQGEPDLSCQSVWVMIFIARRTMVHLSVCLLRRCYQWKDCSGRLLSQLHGPDQVCAHHLPRRYKWFIWSQSWPWYPRTSQCRGGLNGGCQYEGYHVHSDWLLMHVNIINGGLDLVYCRLLVFCTQSVTTWMMPKQDIILTQASSVGLLATYDTLLCYL